MPAGPPSLVRFGRGQLPASVSTRRFRVLRPAWSRRRHAPVFASGAPSGHSRGVLVRCRGEGKAPCDGHGDDEVLGTHLQRARDDADPRGRAGLSGLEPDGAARTVCELLRWRRPNGRLKARECREFLERLDAEGALALPDKRLGRVPGSVTRVPRTAAGEPGCPLVGSVRDIEPLSVEPVREPAERLLFRELVGRYHYLGHAVPFGAHLRYLVFASRPQRVVVGCLQFSSPAWRMAARDGWDDATRSPTVHRPVVPPRSCGLYVHAALHVRPVGHDQPRSRDRTFVRAGLADAHPLARPDAPAHLAENHDRLRRQLHLDHRLDPPSGHGVAARSSRRPCRR